MSLKRYLRGYDRASEVLRVQYDFPDDLLPLARPLIGDVSDDPDLLDPHALTPAHVREIAEKLGLPIDGSRYDFYLEAEEDWRLVAEWCKETLGT